MTICGVLVHAKAGMTEQVQTHLTALPGVEVHAAKQGRLVVTVESEHERHAADTILDVQRLEGVLSAALVYHHSEQDTDLTT